MRVICMGLVSVSLLLAGATPAGADPALYAVSSGSGNVFGYNVSALDGSLSPLGEPTVAAGQSATNIAVSPNGRSVYVTTRGAVTQFDVSSAGALTPKYPGTVPAGQIPVGVVVSPDGDSVYVADAGGTVLQYDVGPSGALSPKNAAPITSPPAPSGLAISPDGRSVYVSNYGTQAANTALVYQYNVLTGGGLSPKSQPTVTADYGPSSVTLSPDG